MEGIADPDRTHGPFMANRPPVGKYMRREGGHGKVAPGTNRRAGVVMGAYLWIGIGGALGSMARHWCNGFIGRLAGLDFPWSTLTINIVGSFRAR
jgi:hypothetical protein